MFDPKLLLPEIIYALPGFEINIYFQNIVTVINPDNYAFDVECAKGRCDQLRWRWIPDDEDVYTPRYTHAPAGKPRFLYYQDWTFLEKNQPG